MKRKWEGAGNECRVWVVFPRTRKELYRRRGNVLQGFTWARREGSFARAAKGMYARVSAGVSDTAMTGLGILTTSVINGFTCRKLNDRFQSNADPVCARLQHIERERNKGK